MIYTVITSNGQSYDLPNKTLKVMEELDKIMRIDDIKGLDLKGKYKKILEFAINMLGADNITDILGDTSVDSIDVGELEVLILRIRDAYNAPAENYQKEQLKNAFDSIPIEKLNSLTKTADSVRMMNINKK